MKDSILPIIVSFAMYFRWNFVEKVKTLHFWKPYRISNQKNNVSICTETHMAAILDITKWLP